MYDEGRYKVRITGAALGESQPKDDGSTTPHIELYLEIQGMITADGSILPDNNPEPRTTYMPLTDATLGTPQAPGWVTLTLTDLGFTWKSYEDLAALTGKIRNAQCKHDMYSGEAKEKWSVYRENRSPQRPLEPKGVRTLNSKFGHLLKAYTHGPAASSPYVEPPLDLRPIQAPLPIPNSSTRGDEDIPF